MSELIGVQMYGWSRAYIIHSKICAVTICDMHHVYGLHNTVTVLDSDIPVHGKFCAYHKARSWRIFKMNHSTISSNIFTSNYESTGVDFRHLPDNVSLATCKFIVVLYEQPRLARPFAS